MVWKKQENGLNCEENEYWSHLFTPSLIHIGSKHSEWPLETPSHDLKVSKMLAKPSTFAQYCVKKNDLGQNFR